MTAASHFSVAAGRRWSWCGVMLLLAVSHATSAETLRLYPPDIERLNFPELAAILRDETSISLESSIEEGESFPTAGPLDALVARDAELAVVEASHPFMAGIRTVLPLYESVVHLAVRTGFSTEELHEEQRGPRIDIVQQSPTGTIVADLLFSRSKYLPGYYERWEAGSGVEPDFVIYLGPIDPRSTSWFRDGFQLVSLREVDEAGMEFYTEGISYLVPQLRTARIPALTYSLPGNETGIDALAVDMLLVAHREVSREAIYALTEALVEQKPRFAAVEPRLFRWINTDLSDNEFPFPLHRGARRYFERDEPGFLERYAETMNFVAYVFVMVVTGLVALGRWRSRRRKDRIDDFYVRVMALREARDAPEVILESLDQIETEAFRALIEERLAADSSFRIFMDLVWGLRRELKADLSGAATAEVSSRGR